MYSTKLYNVIVLNISRIEFTLLLSEGTVKLGPWDGI
jgi:hypothetical protein